MITGRDREILRTLRDKVRLLTLGQVATTWWHGELGPAARRLRKLDRGGWLVGERLLARPILPLASPLFSWRPKQAAPDFGHLSWLAQSRWTLPAASTPVWRASPLAASRLGGEARSYVKNLCQVTHDLHVSELYVRLLRGSDPLARKWIGEDALPEGLISPLVPDAAILGDAAIEQLVEFGGAYPRQRFETFHAHCRTLALPYTCW